MIWIFATLSPSPTTQSQIAIDTALLQTGTTDLAEFTITLLFCQRKNTVSPWRAISLACDQASFCCEKGPTPRRYDDEYDPDEQINEALNNSILSSTVS